MNPYVTITASLFFQFVAAYLALRLVRVTGRNTAWLVITAAVSVLALRRCFTLSSWLSGAPILANDITEQLVALIASALMAVGLALIEPLFLSIKRSEMRARQSEERYRILVDNIPAVVFTGYEDGSIDFFDNKVENLTGYLKEDFHSRQIKWIDIIKKEDLSEAKRAFIDAFKADKSYVREYRIRPKVGQPVWIQERSRIICNPEGAIDHVSGVFFDISDHRMMEEKLRESERRFRAFMEHSPAAAFIKDRQGHYLYVNEVCERFADLKTGEWLGLTDFDLWPEDVAKEHRDSDQAVLQGNYPLTSLVTIPSPQGELTYWSVYKFPIIPNSLENALIGGMAVDVTEQKQAEERRVNLESQLLQAQKLEAIGRLAGGVAHDFNNLLLAILGYSELVVMDLEPYQPIRQLMEEIIKAAQRGKTLTGQLLAFSRKQVIVPQILNINKMVGELEQMLRRLLGEDINLMVFLDEDLETVKADPGQIEQVIMNLVVNARDAISTGGTITIKTANVEFDEEYAKNFMALRPAPYVMLMVSDNGAGIDAETLPHIFEPFFTTKNIGKGTGLGLAMVYGIVKQNGGEILVNSRPGEGTTFQIYFPLADEAGTAAEVKRESVINLQGTETILVVEDEEPVRAMLSEALRRYGYNVLEAKDGQEAMDISSRCMNPIHVLLTDVVMPQMSGRELAERLIQIHPEAMIIYMSGYSDNAINLDDILRSGASFIQKPFNFLQLAHKVREVLNAKGR